MAGDAREHVRRVVAREGVELLGVDDDSLVIAVPPTYDTRQLGMLVAMTRELNVPLAGLVASPVTFDAAVNDIIDLATKGV